MNVAPIPSHGFARSAIVRMDGGPNMLVIRGMGHTTAVIVNEGEESGTTRLREVESRRLVQVLPPAAEQDRASDLRWNADMRAIKLWQDRTGKTLVWPDHADLCVWLLDQLDRANARLLACGDCA